MIVAIKYAREYSTNSNIKFTNYSLSRILWGLLQEHILMNVAAISHTQSVNITMVHISNLSLGQMYS